MFGSMVNIHSATAEIRRRKNEEEDSNKKKPHDENIMSASATQGGHNNVSHEANLLWTKSPPATLSRDQIADRRISEQFTIIGHRRAVSDSHQSYHDDRESPEEVRDTFDHSSNWVNFR